MHDDVELAFHFCYGDSKFGASPFMGDPPDELAAARGGRHIYPATRRPSRRGNKLAHWQPLANLAIEPETESYLGLVHAEDGVAGARYRGFGLSTECGLGRHSTDQLDQVVDAVDELFQTQKVNAGI